MPRHIKRNYKSIGHSPNHILSLKSLSISRITQQEPLKMAATAPKVPLNIFKTCKSLLYLLVWIFCLCLNHLRSIDTILRAAHSSFTTINDP